MSDAATTIRLYHTPQSFPCGPASTCCGPVGQSEEELQGYLSELRKGLPGVLVELIDVSQKLRIGRDLPVLKLINTFGMSACPIFTVNDEVVSMGPPAMSELIALLAEKLPVRSPEDRALASATVRPRRTKVDRDGRIPDEEAGNL